MHLTLAALDEVHCRRPLRSPFFVLSRRWQSPPIRGLAFCRSCFGLDVVLPPLLSLIAVAVSWSIWPTK